MLDGEDRRGQPDDNDMQRGYTKLFNTLITSTVWQENDKTRIIWITMLALADQTGGVHASIPGLAMVARVDIEATRKALENLMAPDPDSRTKEHEGRRIEEIDGGWRILNYAKYCAMMSKAERQEYKARWMREKRRQQSGRDVDNGGHEGTPDDARGRGGHTQTQTQTHTNKNTGARSAPPAFKEVSDYAKSKGKTEEQATAFWSHWESVGWKRNKQPIVKWKAAFANWCIKDTQLATAKRRPFEKPKERAPTTSAYRPLYEAEEAEFERDAKLAEQLNLDHEKKKN